MRRLIVLLALPVLCCMTPAHAQVGAPAPDAYADGPDQADKDVTGDASGDASKDAPKVEKKVDPPMKQPEDVGEAMKDVGVLIQAAKDGNWPLFAGIIVMLIVFVLDKLVGLKEKVGKKAMPWVAAVLGIVGTMGVSLTDASMTWWWALIQGLLAGATAVGLWELLGKHFAKKKEAPAG